MSIFVFLAALPATQPSAPPHWYEALFQGGMFPIILAFGLFYLLMFRSKRGQDKQRDQMLKQMKRGDRVQTIGGIIGTVLEARETEVVVKVDEGNNTKIKFARSAIHRVLDEDKVAAK